QVEIDPSGGQSYINVGAAQLQSVPYAFYAAGAAPSGAAGGSLSGTYPNPVLANNAVQTVMIEEKAVTGDKLADETITAGKLAPGTIPVKLPPTGAAEGDL